MFRLSACLFAVLFVGACAPEPVPPPVYPSEAVPPESRDEEEKRQLAVEKPVDPGHSDPGEARTNLGKTPRGSWKNSAGADVDVATLTEGRGAIVVFYRGFWCKFCRTQLSELQAAIAEFRGRGFDVHAVSTDTPDKAKELKARLGLDFELYSDVGGLSTRAWGVYSKEFDLARPAVFVIAPGGEITYRYVSDTPADRPKVSELLELAKKARPPEKGP